MAEIILKQDNIKKIVESTLKNLYESTYRGVPGTQFIWHGEWADPEIKYQGELINGNEFEDTLWNLFNEETGSDDEDEYETWIKKQGKDFVKNELDNYLFCMNENNTKKNNKNMNNTVRLTEQELHNIIKESVIKVLNENEMDEDWANFKSKLGSAAKGAGTFLRNGGMNAAKSAYNDNRANFMDQQAGAQEKANEQAIEGIKAKYNQMETSLQGQIEQLQRQLQTLPEQMEQEIANVGKNNVDFSGQAQDFKTKASNARKAQYNFWNPQAQQQ